MEDEQPAAEQAAGQEAPEPTPTPTRSSLKSWLSSTREQIAEKKTYEIPLPGFAGRLVGVYHPPGEKVMQKVGKRNDKQPDEIKNLLTACDIVTECCDDVYAIDGSERVSLGPWSPQMVRENFEVDNPEITTPRRALLAIYCTDELHFLITKHFNKLVELVEEDAPEVVAELGEDSATSTPTSSG